MPRGSSPSSKPSGGFFNRSQPARPAAPVAKPPAPV